MSMITTNKAQVRQLRQTPVKSQPGRCHARFTPSILNQESTITDEIERINRQRIATSCETRSDGDGDPALHKTIPLRTLRRAYAFGRFIFYLAGTAGISIIFLPVLAIIWLAHAITASDASFDDTSAPDPTSIANSGDCDVCLNDEQRSWIAEMESFDRF